MWAAFQDSRLAGVLGVRSIWPRKVLLDQLLQVRLRFAGNTRPSAVEPVMASCWFGCIPTPLTIVPFSVSAVSRVILLLAPWRSSTLVATTSPLKFFHGPLPMRSRALTGPPGAPALVLR